MKLLCRNLTLREMFVKLEKIRKTLKIVPKSVFNNKREDFVQKDDWQLNLNKILLKTLSVLMNNAHNLLNTSAKEMSKEVL